MHIHNVWPFAQLFTPLTNCIVNNNNPLFSYLALLLLTMSHFASFLAIFFLALGVVEGGLRDKVRYRIRSGYDGIV